MGLAATITLGEGESGRERCFLLLFVLIVPESERVGPMGEA